MHSILSRQGQGTRRRKKVKTKEAKSNDTTVDEVLAITSPLSPMPSCPTSGASANPSVASVCNARKVVNNNGRINSNNDGLCNGMQELQIEDNIICKSISQGIGKDHYGIHCLVRQWVSLSFSRRSFSLLARASFIAAKLGISMDDILANQSPFAIATGSLAC